MPERRRSFLDRKEKVERAAGGPPNAITILILAISYNYLNALKTVFAYHPAILSAV